jgi:hypothetical protein
MLAPTVSPDDPTIATEPPPRSSRWSGVLDPTSPVPLIAGVVLGAAGFVLIAIAWSNIAGLTDVSKQMPYLVSAGFTGLGLVMAGLLVVNLAVKRRDADEQRRQIEHLTAVLDDLKRTLEDGG